METHAHTDTANTAAVRQRVRTRRSNLLGRLFDRPIPRAIVGAALALVIAAVPATAARAGMTNASTVQSSTTLRVWYASDDPTETPLAQSLARAFEQAHPGVTVALSTYGLDDMNAKMLLALGSGSPPDLIYTTPRGPGLPTYVHAGRLLDLSAAAQKGGWAASLRPGLLAQYNDLLTRTGQARGHVFAAPYVLAAVGVLYNQAIFSRLHLSVPRTLAGLEAVCAAVKKAGLTPIGFGNADGWVGDDWYLTLVNSLAGPAALAPEQHLDPHFHFAGPAAVGAGQTLQRWAGAGYFTPQFAGLDAQDSVEAFFGGHTAMQLVSSSENGQIVADAARTHAPIGLFAFPSADSKQAPVMPQSGYAGWAVPAAARQPALATAFITQLLSASTAQTLLTHGLLPARPVAVAAASAASGPFQRAYLQALATSAPGIYLDGAPVPNLNATMEANVELLLQQLETPDFLARSLQTVYDSGGARATSTRTDGEF